METSPETTIFLLRPFFIALYIGLLFSIVIFIREKAHQRKLKKENVKLKEHIQTKLEIEAETNEKVRKDIEELKRQNENLRISLQALDVKPGRSEIKQLHIYQKAVEILTEKAPGFAQSWQSAIKEVQEDMRKIDLGRIPIFRRLLPGRGSSRKKIDDNTDS
jgi:hypothetical protein